MIAPDFEKVWAVIPPSKLDDAAEKASSAFWDAIASCFPEVTTGDYPPDLTYEFEKGGKRAIAWWLTYNHPGLK